MMALEQIIAEKAKANLRTKSQPLANLPKAAPVNTRKEVAAIAGVSERTYAKGKDCRAFEAVHVSR